VSISFLPVAATVAYAEGRDRYEEMRRLAIRRFGSTSNPTVAEQVLKASLILSADQQTLLELRSLATALEKDIQVKNGELTPNPAVAAWAKFAMALWNFRSGDFEKALQWADQCEAVPDLNMARAASLSSIRAIIAKQWNQSAKAQALVEDCREQVRHAIAGKIWANTPGSGFWFDWVIAALLLAEAEKAPGPA
jgi:hypothetical protein